MVTHMLQALSESAKALKGPYGSDIPVDLHTKLGRKVSGPYSVNLPHSWGQVSQTHCTIFSEDQGVSAAHLCFWPQEFQGSVMQVLSGPSPA